MSKIFTTSDLNTYTGKTLDSARAQQVVSAVNSFIETRTGRCWGETRQVTETYDLRSTNYLRHMDITDVSAVKFGRGDEQVTADTDRYFWNKTGRLQCEVRDWASTQPAGYMDAPRSDLQLWRRGRAR